ncbi:unnamed protein product [Hymenolepis diminuta]|uniref:Uncharacterized protein n=1 Tax=Hymenolepis diminuta TaxID=6216 RepID=A0A564Z2P9_HYMDI|nr:unnamed protein product [Hymenolepis diminuta]
MTHSSNPRKSVLLNLFPSKMEQFQKWLHKMQAWLHFLILGISNTLNYDSVISH